LTDSVDIYTFKTFLGIYLTSTIIKKLRRSDSLYIHPKFIYIIAYLTENLPIILFIIFTEISAATNTNYTYQPVKAVSDTTVILTAF